MRDGTPVRKSRLVVDPRTAKRVQAFLNARAAGEPRTSAAKAAHWGDTAIATLVGIERNALTYAGYTVWNQRIKVKPSRDNPKRTMEWRPRHEWVVSEKPTKN